VRMFFSRGMKRWGALAAAVLLSPLLLTACGENSPSILNTSGPVAAHESDVFWAILVIATIVFVGVEGMLVWSIFRFRERPGMPSPHQNHGNLKLEMIWTIVPMLILFVVLFYTIRGLFQVAPEAEPISSNTVTVEAIGHQWWWEFYYPKYHITTADTMHIPENTDIHVDLYSNNVIHSFWVPALTGKTDVVPGHSNMKWFKADAGTAGKDFLGICAEYCGTQHANMRFSVHVDSADSFQSWITTQQQAAATPQSGSLAAQGAQIFQQECTSCHGIVGVDIKSPTIADPSVVCDAPSTSCLIGPNLTHFGSRQYIAGGVLSNNVNDDGGQACDPNNPQLLQQCHLAQWINDPQGMKPGNDMNIGQLSPSQIKALVAYLEGLK
jgi:cytochrome c oxidase subunit II